MYPFVNNDSVPAPIRMKRWAAPAVATLAIGAVVLTGCTTETKSEPTSTAPPTLDTSRSGTPPSVDVTDAQALLDQAAKTTRLTSGVHLNLAVDPDFRGMPVNELDADVVTTPSPAAKGSGSFRFDEEYTSAEFVVVDGRLYTKKEGETAFTAQPEGQRSYDPSVVLSEDKGLANLLSKFKNPKIAGTEDHNGVKAVKITGTLDSTDFDPIFPTQGPGQLKGEHPATAWVAADAPNNLVEIVLNTTDGDIALTTSKWNETVTITKP
ncbi:LppX_LprAFG lipoprotein [Gordonia hydrophobica]|uniref:LppX_LprAFG lipoprotein n=1 Tax=Gordonia hydrophobica TaxID=40516 RepID=A0ABZ2U051_9ACTN|nr:LppX_LprAFG lipoprotein [Gordonia hydrophobica]MBM7369526.1 lipoprotein LprG [Gordonia hydrophobica]